jgi:hypothetical protein
MGRVTVRFAPPDDGVPDHDVTLPSGEVVHTVVPVLPHRDRAEVVFPALQADASDADCARDVGAAAADLARPKTLLER